MTGGHVHIRTTIDLGRKKSSHHINRKYSSITYRKKFWSKFGSCVIWLNQNVKSELINKLRTDEHITKVNELRVVNMRWLGWQAPWKVLFNSTIKFKGFWGRPQTKQNLRN